MSRTREITGRHVAVARADGTPAVGGVGAVDAVPAFSAVAPASGVAPARHADAPAPSPCPGPTRFGDYELIEPIAQGGMGAVWRARQVGVNRVVALKMILAGRFASAQEVRRFRAEAEAAGALDHPHIVPVHEVGEHDGRHFFSMKYVAGGSLAQRMHEFSADPRAATALLAAVARAVHHAHQHGVLHRDLKPSNVLLDEAGRPYVTDFGLSKRLLDGHDNGYAGLTLSEAVVGTPSYMAPEQAAGGSKRATVAADVYGIGAILYETLTGHPPFSADTRLETLRRVQEEEPSSVRSANRRVGRDLETVCLKCLAKDPRRRYGSAEAVAEDLERWLAGKPVRARRTSLPERAWRWSKRHPARAALVAVVFLSTVFLTAGGLWHARRLGEALEIARQENERAAAVTGFLRDVFRAAAPENARGRRVTVEEALDEAARTVGQKFDGQPLTEAEVRTIIGRIYTELGKALHAEEQHRAALELRQAALGPDHLETAASHHLVADARRALGFPLRAMPHARKAYQVRHDRLGPEHRDTLDSMDVLAYAVWGRGTSNSDLLIPGQLLERRLRTAGAGRPETLLALAHVARVEASKGNRAAALKDFRAAADGLRLTLGVEDPRTLMVLSNFAATLDRSADDTDEAEALFREVLDARTRTLGPTHTRTRRSLDALGRLLLRRGRPCDPWEARAVFETLLDAHQGAGANPLESYAATSCLADAVQLCGDVNSAAALRAAMMESYRRDYLGSLRRDDPALPPRRGASIPVNAWTDLLAEVDPPRHSVRGDWRFVPGGLRVGRGLHSRLVLPAEVNGSYELDVEFTRTGGADGMAVVFPAGRGSVVLAVAWFGYRNGLRFAWFKDSDERGNRTAQDGRIVNNLPYRLRAMVRLLPEGRCRVEATLDGRPCITGWEGPQEALHADIRFHLPAGATLGLSAHDAEYVFHAIRLRVLDGEAATVEFGTEKLKDLWWAGDEDAVPTFLRGLPVTPTQTTPASPGPPTAGPGPTPRPPAAPPG